MSHTNKYEWALTPVKEKYFLARKTRPNCMLYIRTYLKQLFRNDKNKEVDKGISRRWKQKQQE